MKEQFRYVIVLFFLVISPLLSAQPHSVSGVVKDDAGEPMVGASVLIEGTTRGTMTDADGAWSLSVSPEDVLLFEFIGFTPVSEKVGSRTHIDVTLHQDSQVLEDVVVVGYGVQKKVNVTGSVATVDYGEMAGSRPATTAGALLRGTSAGVYVSQNSGMPGAEDIKIKIRGNGTFNDSSPLVIVDGFESSISRVNPADIETVSILKDAASCAIYGNRGANGVVLITTKQARDGSFTLEYNMMLSYEEPHRVLKQMDNYADFMELINEASYNIGMAQPYSQASIDTWRAAQADPNGIAPSGYPNYVAYPNVNWLDAIFTPGIYQKHTLSASGASSDIKYRMSLDYMDNPGIFEGMGYQRVSYRTNLSTRINSWIETGISFFGFRSRSEVNDWDSQVGMLARSLPDIYPYYDGKYGWYENTEDAALARNSLYFIRMAEGATIGNVVNLTPFLTMTLPLGIILKTQLNYQWHQAHREFTRNPLSAWSFSRNETAYTATPLENLAKNGVDESDLDWTFHTDLNWSGKYGDSEISSLLGFEMFDYRKQSASFTKKNRSNEILSEFDNFVEVSSISGNSTEYSTESFFGRVNYAWKDRYLAEANFRLDGSSRFSARSRWGFFPSVSAGWRINKEPWMAGTKIDNLKVRASWGRLGNHSIGNYDYISKYSSGSNYPFGGTIRPGYIYSLSNDSLEWETTTTADLGVDFAILSNRLTAEADIYNKLTDGILSTAVISSCIGTKAAPKENLYSMLNRGLELTLGWKDTRGDFSYGIRANVSRNWNIVSKYLGEFKAGWETDEHGIRTYKSNYGETVKKDSNAMSTAQGHLPSELYLMPVYHGDGSHFFADGSVNPDGGPKDGMIRTPEDMQWLEAMLAAGNTFGPYNRKAAKNGIWYGDYIYADVNGDRIYGDANDRQFSGANKTPKLYYGLNLNASWKGFDFSAELMGTAGARMFWWLESYSAMGLSRECNYPQRFAYDHYFYDPDNPSDPRTNLTSANGRVTLNIGSEQNGNYTELWRQNMDFLKIKSLTFGYTLPDSLMKKLRMSNARVFLSGDNLYTFTKYQGVDPEYDGYRNFYSSLRQYTLGLNIAF
ncbi:MAG: TonB-dependent receptor [Bacteroidales bacterium]|nr:TonB-dependent receptor [Bacteroidales bacterium]